MQNYKRVADIAEILIGYTFRGPLKASVDKGVRVLQAKNIRENESVDIELLTRAEIDLSHSKSFTQSGDVIMGSRGVFRAGYVRADEKLLFASSVFVLRPHSPEQVLPEYLALYLNSNAGKRELAKVITQGTIKTLLKKDLMLVQVPVPSIEQQKKLVQLQQNISEQVNLLHKQAQAKENILQGIFHHFERTFS